MNSMKDREEGFERKFVFDEELGLLIARAKALGIDIEAMRDANKLFIEQMDAAELSPGEFVHRVRACVDRENIRTVAPILVTQERTPRVHCFVRKACCNR